MNANLCGSICLYCISGKVWPLQLSSLTRGRPPQPPRPLLPRPKPRWRRGAKRLDGADARTGGYHHRQRLCQPSGLECQSVWVDQSVLHSWPCVAITSKQPYARSAPSAPPPLTPPAKAPVEKPHGPKKRNRPLCAYQCRAIVPNGSVRRASGGVLRLFGCFILLACGGFRFRSIGDNRSTNIDQIKSGRCPWLSPSFSRSTSIRSSNDNHKLLIGVSLGNTMCLPVLSVPEPPPATRMGKSS